ncbi:MAG: 2-hydroxyacyl-CoA dehydratase subunit D [Promethearchaeota archaeon]
MMDRELLDEYTEFLMEKKAEGKQFVAFLAHDNIPEELLVAGGFIPIRLVFAGNDELMNESHDYLPSSTCSFAQSCIGLFSLKPFRFLEKIDYFIVSNHCVSDICASEIISKYFFIPRINFYSSYTNDDNSLKYYKLELIELKRELEKILGEEITKEKIISTIKEYNKLRLLLKEIDQLKIKGSLKLNAFHRAILFGLDSLDYLNSFIEEYKDKKIVQENNSKDLILTGCSIFLGDYLIDLIEEGGGNIVFFDSWIGYNYYSQSIPDNLIKSIEDPLDLFVHRFKNNITGDHTVPYFLENKISHLEKLVKEYESKTGKKLAVINHIIKFCDHFSLFQTDLKQNLQERGIKVLNLERDYSKSIRGQLSTRIEAFLEMI